MMPTIFTGINQATEPMRMKHRFWKIGFDIASKVRQYALELTATLSLPY
jgi:hypothetical protein